MAKIFTTVVKKIIQQAGGAVNYPFKQSLALTQRTFLSTVQQQAFVAYDIIKTTYSYSGLYGATAAASAPVTGNTNWTNPNNAVGSNNGTNATLAASLTAAANANLTLTYAAVANKTMFTITKVELLFYSALTVGLLQTASITYRYSLNGGTNYTQVFTSSAAVTHSGFVVDITAAVAGNWNNLQNVRVQINGNLGTSATSGNASVDAVLLRITTNPIEQVQ